MVLAFFMQLQRAMSSHVSTRPAVPNTSSAEPAVTPVWSVLTKAHSEQVRTKPFPYLVIENCLPPEFYSALESTYPSDEQILSLNAARRAGKVRQNQRNNVSAHQILGTDALNSRWEQFVRHHTSPVFYRDVLRVFASLRNGERCGCCGAFESGARSRCTVERLRRPPLSRYWPVLR